MCSWISWAICCLGRTLCPRNAGRWLNDRPLTHILHCRHGTWRLLFVGSLFVAYLLNKLNSALCAEIFYAPIFAFACRAYLFHCAFSFPCIIKPHVAVRSTFLSCKTIRIIFPFSNITDFWHNTLDQPVQHDK